MRDIMLILSGIDTLLSTGAERRTEPSTTKPIAAAGNGCKRWHSDPVPTKTAPGAAGAPGPRFLTLADVAEILSTSVAQVRALVRNHELRHIQIGGRQQYRIEVSELEAYIQRMYDESDARKADESEDRTAGENQS
jgi:excisionase family DNA binding protein